MHRPQGVLAVGWNPRQHWGEQPSGQAKSPEFLGQLSWTRLEDKLGRPKTQGKCKIKGCGKDAASRFICWGHYKAWDRAYGHLRCHWPDCRAHQDDGGRRMNGVFYCRAHEPEHLRITAQAHELNRQRLGHGLTADANGCWLWDGSVNDGGYGTFVPEGANTAKWLAHRVAWGLLIGGHKPGLQLDHRTCKRRRCVNPMHLEVVTTSTNQRRKRQGPEWGWINPDAVKDPRVTEFARLYGLPLPVPPPQALTSSSAAAWPRFPPPPERPHAQSNPG